MVLRILLLLMAALVGGGCRTTAPPEAARSASITISHHSPAEIENALKAVFESHGYLAKPQGDAFIFQKKASWMKTVEYGDWYEGTVWEQVKVSEEPLDSQSTHLSCEVFLVQEPEDPLFRKERRLNGRNDRCQKMLEEIAEGVEHPEGRVPPRP